MKTALTGIPELDSGVIAELYTITLKSGATLHYTTADLDLPYRGQTYLAGVFNLERGVIKSSVGVEVDDVDLTIYQHADDTLAGLTFPQFVLNGGFDGAIIKIERARKSRVVHLFEGLVSDANADRTQIRLTVSAPAILLNIDMPHNLYAPGCIYSHFDTGCGLDRADFAVNGVVATGSTVRLVECDLVQADDYFDLGKIIFTSGANAGSVRTIKNYTTGSITLSYALQHAPEAGDAFTAYPGCDKRRVSCQAYGNEARFRGYPLMPVKEASI